MVGIITRVGDDGASYDFRVPKLGKVLVEHSAELKFRTYSTRPLKEVADGTKVFVLGTKQEAQSNVPPQIVRVAIIVIGDFTPLDSLPEDLTRQGNLSWIEDKLRVEGKVLRLGAYELVAGGDRHVVVAKHGKPDAIEPRRTQAFAVGEIGSNGGGRSLYAKKFVFLGEGLSDKEHAILLDLGKRVAIKKQPPKSAAAPARS
jgi:hypothetical protein